MSIRTKVAGLACLISLLAPAAAQASAPSVQDRGDAQRFAKRYWAERGAYAPCRHVNVRVAPRGAMGGPHGDLGVWRTWQPCIVWLNRDVSWSEGGTQDSWWRVCATVIHEYGHAVGRGHTSNPESIMAKAESLSRYGASWWPYFEGCRYDGDDADGDGTPDW